MNQIKTQIKMAAQNSV